MGMYKWIFGALGAAAFGPLGAFAGFFLGYMFEDKDDESDGYQQQYSGGGGYNQSRVYSAEEQRNSFLFSLLVLATYIIRADGKVLESEKQCVRNFLRKVFGYDAEVQGMDILERLLQGANQMTTTQYEQQIMLSARQMGQILTYEQRMMILSFLADISKSDGNVDPLEVRNLKQLALAMGLSDSEVDSMLSLHGTSLEDAYRVLEISPDATDAEVKSAYRKLVHKHHPDHVATLGDDVKRAAEEKFKEITRAKDQIYAARGMK